MVLILIVLSAFQMYFGMKLKNFKLFHREFFIIRDDLLSLGKYVLSGNKARKLKFFFHNNNNDNIKVLASYGGYQSNSMLAIAKIANELNYDFFYYTKKIPNFVKTSQLGNYKNSIDLGAKVK